MRHVDLDELEEIKQLIDQKIEALKGDQIMAYSEYMLKVNLAIIYSLVTLPDRFQTINLLSMEPLLPFGFCCTLFYSAAAEASPGKHAACDRFEWN